MDNNALLQSLFLTQKKYIDYFFTQIDVQQVDKILQQLLSCKGVIFFLGVGKSGIIAEKIAMTMASTGTKAFYLSAMNIPHGDLGVLSADDLCVLISRSGETPELLAILPYLVQKGVKTMAWVSAQKSSLAKRADMSIVLPLEKEICPFGLAPTTSTAIQLIFGDILSVALMQKKAFSLQEYGRNHPSGSIGSLITTKVEDVMISGDALPICFPEDKLKDVLVRLSDKRCGCLVIVDAHHRMQGIFTDGDLRRALQSRSSEILEEMMQNLMTKKYLSIQKDKLLHEAAQIMQKDEKKKVLVLPVLAQDKLIGLLHMHDITRINMSKT